MSSTEALDLSEPVSVQLMSNEVHQTRAAQKLMKPPHTYAL
jgi:hypothetical protein